MQNEEAVHARGTTLRALTEGHSAALLGTVPGIAQVLSTAQGGILERAKVLLVVCTGELVPCGNG